MNRSIRKSFKQRDIDKGAIELWYATMGRKYEILTRGTGKPHDGKVVAFVRVIGRKENHKKALKKQQRAELPDFTNTDDQVAKAEKDIVLNEAQTKRPKFKPEDGNGFLTCALCGRRYRNRAWPRGYGIFKIELDKKLSYTASSVIKPKFSDKERAKLRPGISYVCGYRIGCRRRQGLELSQRKK